MKKEHEAKTHHEGKRHRSHGGGLAIVEEHEHEHKKAGGRMKRKAGGPVHGHKPKHRLDKKARGGSAEHPLSGADAPNKMYAHDDLKAGSEGTGKDRD